MLKLIMIIIHDRQYQSITSSLIERNFGRKNEGRRKDLGKLLIGYNDSYLPISATLFNPIFFSLTLSIMIHNSSPNQFFRAFDHYQLLNGSKFNNYVINN